MKAPSIPNPRNEQGYGTMAMVSAISLVIVSMMAYSLVGNIRSMTTQARAQVKQDYSQREDAILTALIHIVPNKAIGAMQQGSASSTSAYTWDTIFSQALAMANAEQAISPQLVNSLNLGTAISANSGNTQFQSVSQFVNAPLGTPAGGSNRVNGGNTMEYTMLGSTRIAPRVPAALQLSYNDYLLDKQYPIISLTKTHSTSYTKGLGLSASLFPLYNLIQYPDVKFGYKRPGEYFVAKRNWWVFSLTFGSHNQETTGIPPVTKDYVLSIYEIPSQIPLSADTLMKVGQFSNGSDWENVTLDGSIYADSLQTNGSVALDNGAMSARKTLTVSNDTTVAGRSVASNFDALGARETRAVETNTGANTGSNATNNDFYDASTGGNVGKVAFIPINRGNESLLETSDGLASERISPTGWNYYSQAAPKATMTLEVRSVTSSGNQTPTSIRFTYRNSSNADVTRTYTRGASGTSAWPTEAQTGGSAFPFQTATLENGRVALVVKMDRIPAFVAGLTSTGGMSKNNSLYIFSRTDSGTVKVPSIPSLTTDMAVTLRGGNDLTDYTAGFSLVSRYRVYIASTLNDVATTIPANSGIAPGTTFYPPLSIFAPEKRFGESTTLENRVQIRGQLNSLKTGANETFNPLELKRGSDVTLAPVELRATLTSLQSPAELPPIFMMNWLVTIEGIN